MKKQHHIVAAVGENRTGIVADVSEMIFTSGCNIEDSQMSRLGDQFALLTLVSAKDQEAARALLAGCEALKTSPPIQAVVFPVKDCWPHCPHAAAAGEANHLLRAVGQDRTGIVSRCSRILAAVGVDIVDLKTHITRAPESGIPIFTMEAHLAVPEGMDPTALRRELKALSDEMVIDISVRPLTP